MKQTINIAKHEKNTQRMMAQIIDPWNGIETDEIKYKYNNKKKKRKKKRLFTYIRVV